MDSLYSPLRLSLPLNTVRCGKILWCLPKKKVFKEIFFSSFSKVNGEEKKEVAHENSLRMRAYDACSSMRGAQKIVTEVFNRIICQTSVIRSHRVTYSQLKLLKMT